jgi:Lecithin:cholesterol acyltransferase
LTGTTFAATTHDAVVIIPGIMGSALRDTRTGDLVWGLSDPRWYVRAWTRPDGLRALHVTDEERAGRTGRIEPHGLLRFPAWAPWLAGLEPYTKLVRQVREVVADPTAVLEFAYDWRLPVEHNARLLAGAMADHLAAWQRHDAQVAARRRHPDGRPAQLVLVAHSMGGLLAQALTLISGATTDVRTTITLGTPFYGAVKAAMILNTGRGAPVKLPREKLRALARTLPGLHDLLPTYRCLHEGSGPVRLAPEVVERLGGDLELARRSGEFHARVNRAALVGHHSLVGVGQRTMQGLRVRDGVAVALYEAFGHRADGTLVKKDFQGDGTVYWESAALIEGFHEVVQQHGALPGTDEAISLVRDLARAPGGKPRPLLGAGAVGLDLPDVVDVDVEFTALANDVGMTVMVYETTGEQPGRPVEITPPRWEDGCPTVRLILPRPGLYRVEASSAGHSPVTQTVLAVE